MQKKKKKIGEICLQSEPFSDSFEKDRFLANLKWTRLFKSIQFE